MVEKTEKLDKATISGGRNYQLDFLKLIFTFAVILAHTGNFVNENTRTWFIPKAAGWVSVHFFFIVSGLFMVNSFTKNTKNYCNASIQSFDFVLRKFRSISIEYWTALFIGMVIHIFLNIQSVDIFQVIIRDIPEILGITNSGVITQEINGPTWYISAMLISMLPLYYMLCKNKDFFIYIFSPLCALLLYGFMYNQDVVFVDRFDYCGILLGGLIRSVCGICFGVISYIIFSKIISWCKTNNDRKILTIMELMLYILFFIAWFAEKSDYKTMYAAMLLLPVAVAITFSQKSYISELFKFKIFKHVSKISLALYLNHWAALWFVKKHFPFASYKRSVFLMMILTIVISAAYFITVHVIKKVTNEKRVKNDPKI